MATRKNSTASKRTTGPAKKAVKARKPTTPKKLSFTIPESVWEATEVMGQRKLTRTRLHASLYINGVLFIAEALEVKNDDGLFETVDPDFSENLHDYYLATGADGHMETLTIKNREYAVFITPST